MKVILADEVRGLGHRGATVEVKKGYARNYLIPEGLALEATPANLRRLLGRCLENDPKKRLREPVILGDARFALGPYGIEQRY